MVIYEVRGMAKVNIGGVSTIELRSQNTEKCSGVASLLFGAATPNIRVYAVVSGFSS